MKASLLFLQGRAADTSGQKLEAKQYYQESLAFWQKKVKGQEPLSDFEVERQGCVLFYLGLWWRQYATLHRAEYRAACLQAKDYFQQCVEGFNQAQRPELVAKFINAWGEVLARLEEIDELEVLAPKAVDLHQTYVDPIRLAYSYGFFAEIALKKSNWPAAKNYAELALITNTQPLESKINRDWTRQYHRNLYLLLLAKAQCHLKETSEAIAHLETAKTDSNPQHDPLLHIQILETLRSLYFEQGEYLKAFQIKQEQRSVEQQYGVRAFIGAGRLQPTKQVVNCKLAPIDDQPLIAQEIAASGRQQDVDRLIERIIRPDRKLIVIYGQSGVGKSSIVRAGLEPALRQMTAEARDILPVLIQVYTAWEQTLSNRLAKSLAKLRDIHIPTISNTIEGILQQVSQNPECNLLTVLIFDQFEEFFFVCKDKVKRQEFYGFLRTCLNFPYTKVILSLREDYLHHLLEFNRFGNLEVIDNNILDKNILYYLGNFSPEDARSVIQTLTQRSQLSLEPSLVDELVKDLSTSLGEVRPIELQIVGTQLHTEAITTLSEYQQFKSKEKLVDRFLEEVIKDCGSKNEKIAQLILYLLTDEKGTRPLKTKAELALELSSFSLAKAENLDMVLEIFVKSGLVFFLPETPANRYQLVHDYLVNLIRKKKGAELVQELLETKAKLKLIRSKMNLILKFGLASMTLLTIALIVISSLLYNKSSQLSKQKGNLERQNKKLEEGEENLNNNNRSLQYRNNTYSSLIKNINELDSNPKQEIQRQEAKDLIKKWLKAKQRIFSSPFDREFAKQLTTDVLYFDITKPKGSIDWLKLNKAYYKYGKQNIDSVVRFAATQDAAIIDVKLTEDATLYINGKISKSHSGSKTTTKRFFLRQLDNRWKISDFQALN
ncbi:MAG: DUF4101 domain-containing protein [Acaryochloris sp. RU_4_1]|nr:DUF4101 domain-containing protein [Acaryochloris sp. RU_4_1]NJR53266.1 DUF4101 domain-containing protein [Acaryochloris sp. CRU_2_0]